MGWGGNPRTPRSTTAPIRRRTTARPFTTHGQGRAGRRLLVDQRLQRRRLFREERAQRLFAQQSHCKAERGRLVHDPVRRLPEGTPNCLPIMPGWNYTIRLYRRARKSSTEPGSSRGATRYAIDLPSKQCPLLARSRHFSCTCTCPLLTQCGLTRTQLIAGKMLSYVPSHKEIIGIFREPRALLAHEPHSVGFCDEREECHFVFAPICCRRCQHSGGGTTSRATDYIVGRFAHHHN